MRKDFAIFTGLDDQLLPVLMMGGDGGIMALANVVPQIHRAVCDAWKESNLVKAYEEYRKLLKLVEIRCSNIVSNSSENSFKSAWNTHKTIR